MDAGREADLPSLESSQRRYAAKRRLLTGKRQRKRAGEEPERGSFYDNVGKAWHEKASDMAVSEATLTRQHNAVRHAAVPPTRPCQRETEFPWLAT
jgi:hypothetical protein